MVKFFVIEGNIGGGKSTLLTALEEEYKYSKHIEFWHEPVDKFNNYNGVYHPLDLYYINPSCEASIVQLHIINVLKKYYEQKIKEIKPETKIIFTERSLFSTIIFTKVHHDMGYISEFQRQFLKNETLSSLKALDLNVVDKIIYIHTSISTCLTNIQSRSRLSETEFSDMKPYLVRLAFHFNNFINKFERNYGTNTVKRLKFQNVSTMIKEIQSFIPPFH